MVTVLVTAPPIVMFILIGAEQPDVGVNVYAVVPVVAVFIVAGLHTPVIPFDEVVGNAVGVEPWQNGPIAPKVGVICVVTVTLKVAIAPHCPAAGVKV
jgi:hypothetical protein